MALSAYSSLIQHAYPAWLLAFFALILVKMLRGDINTKGLLITTPGAPVDPERVAIMAVSMFAAGYYLVTGLATGAQTNPQTGVVSMPDVPGAMLVLLGGANSVYLSGKLIRTANG